MILDAIEAFDPGLSDASRDLEPDGERAGAALITAWMIGRISGDLAPATTLEGAWAWFGEGPLRDGWRVPDPVLDELRCLPFDDDFLDLLPYVLDPHCPGSRLDVLRVVESADAARAIRKSRGVFYTPSDVAEYIVASAISADDGALPTVMDPACGTGVFLRAALQQLRRQGQTSAIDIVQRLYGIDISTRTVEACAFVLTLDVMKQMGGPSATMTPSQLWHLIRLNLAAVDSLTVDGPAASLFVAAQNDQLDARVSLRNALTSGQPGNSPGSRNQRRSATALASLFPEMGAGFDVVVANPPYSPIGRRRDIDELRARFNCFADRRPSEATNVFLPFAELMVKWLTTTGVGAAMVLPASIGSGLGVHAKALRRFFADQPGRWEFVFFDRTPDSLFGDDVKQRAAIVTYMPASPPALATTAFLRWTSRTRSRLFTSIQPTVIARTALPCGIPKVASPMQARAYTVFRARDRKLNDLAVVMQRVSVADSPRDACSVFVGGTAYNWLSVHRIAPTRDALGDVPTRSPLIRVKLPDVGAANAVYALLNSRLVYWLWRVEADGFHVPLAFLSGLPVADGLEIDNWLQTLGVQLWQAVTQHPIQSVNGGRNSVTYSPHNAPAIIDDIDRNVIGLAELPTALAAELRDMIMHQIVVDPGDPSRRRHDVAARTA